MNSKNPPILPIGEDLGLKCEIRLIDDNPPVLGLYHENRSTRIVLNNDERERVLTFLDNTPTDDEIGEVVDAVSDLQPESTYPEIIDRLSLSRRRTHIVLTWLVGENLLDTLDIDGVRLWITPEHSLDEQSHD